MKVNLREINKLIKQGFILKQNHPTLDLSIYNYTNKAQYEREWNQYTLMCRGLMLDSQGNVIQRPFGKFFNASELEWQLPNEPYKVYSKMDGSMGILYWNNNEPWIASRGSFNSDQAVIGTSILLTHYSHVIDKLNRDVTYVFEIIHPNNRIVVDYGCRQDLVLLAVIDKETGLDLPLPNIGFPVVEEHEMDIEAVKNCEKENFEGYVLLFQSGLRVKVKLAEYVRLHKICTNVTSKDIWEILRDGRPLEDILDNVPDEFFNWAIATYNSLVIAHDRMRFDCMLDFECRPDGDRRTIAEFFKTRKYPQILFAMLDGKDINPIIYRLIEPGHEKPFSNEYKNREGASQVSI